MTKKDYKLDKMRTMSMFLVIIIHIANYYCRAYNSISQLSFIGAIIFNVISRISVPIFFMISGALLLSKKYDSKKNKKRIIRLLITTVLFTIIYLIWDYYFLNKNIGNIIKLIIEPKRSMLWFLYAIIAIYISLPFTKCMVDNMDKRLNKLFVILWLIFNGIVFPITNYYNCNIVYPIPIISDTYYLGYFIIGYILYKNKSKINYKKYNIKNIIIFSLCMLSAVFFSIIASNIKAGYTNIFFAYRSILIMISSIIAFILLYNNLHNKKNKLISFISNHSFGVYLIHGIVLDLVMKIIPYKKVISFIGIPLCFLIISIISLGIVYLLKKIPVLKEYL